MKYRVMYWNNQFTEFPASDEEHTEIQTHSKHDDLKIAKKVCRDLGYDLEGYDPEFHKSYPPVAFVAVYDSDNKDWPLVYNPRFKPS